MFLMKISHIFVSANQKNMTEKARLDQLEPLMAEFAAQLDYVSAQIKRLQTNTTSMLQMMLQQGDNISFLLVRQEKMENDIADLKGQVAKIQGQMTEMKGQMAEMGLELSGIRSEQAATKESVLAVSRSVGSIEKQLTRLDSVEKQLTRLDSVEKQLIRLDSIEENQRAILDLLKNR